TDTSVLRAKAVSTAQYLDLDEPPKVGETVFWCGYSARGYISGNARVIGYEGAQIIITGEVPNGTSGGPIYTRRGIVGVLTECRQYEGQAWQTYGPCFPVLRRLLKIALPPYPNRPGVIVPKPCPTVVCPLPIPAPDTPQPAVDISALQARIEALEAKVAALEKMPGPTGPRGPPGPAGKDGRDGSNGTNGKDGNPAQLQPIPIDQIAEEITKRLKPIHVQVVKNGKVIQSVDVPLGGTLPLRLVPVSAGAK
ncbi:MAG: hypothetical protein WC655_29770, partial [Candidatus Hydrogenedentales bacterium]